MSLKVLLGLTVLVSLSAQAGIGKQSKFNNSPVQPLDIEFLDLDSSSCMSRSTPLKAGRDVLIGLDRGSELGVRVVPTPAVSRERIKSSYLTVFSSNRPVIQKRADLISLSGSGKNAYYFKLNSSETEIVRSAGIWQAQVTFETQKQVYSETRNLRIFKKSDKIKALIPSKRCEFSNWPVLASEIYYNSDYINERAIEYSYRQQAPESQYQTEKFAGLVDVSNWQDQSWGECPDHDNSSVKGAVGLSYFNANEVSKAESDFFDVTHQFRLPSLSYGYVVRQDAVEIVPYRELEFTDCGLLVDRESEILYQQIVKPTYSFMLLTPLNFNNQQEINDKLLTYPMFNTCTNKEMK